MGREEEEEKEEQRQEDEEKENNEEEEEKNKMITLRRNHGVLKGGQTLFFLSTLTQPQLKLNSTQIELG